MKIAVQQEVIEVKIYIIREHKVILSTDLAEWQGNYQMVLS